MGGNATALRDFADELGLSYVARGKAPGTGPLATQVQGPATHIVGGELPGGFTGILARETLQAKTSGQGPPPPPRHVTVALTRIPESIGYIPALSAHDAASRSFTERLVGAGGLIPLFDHVELESIKFNRTFRIGVFKTQDPSSVRQIFTPSFVDWMAERAPEDHYFDLFGGVLCAATSKPPDDRETIDDICEFTARVAERIRSESLEREGISKSAAPPPSPPMLQYEQRFDDELGKVSWDEPPADAEAASRPYRRFARRGKAGWLVSGLVAAFLAAIPALFLGITAGALADSTPLALGGSAAIFALCFVPIFLKLLRGSFRYQSEIWGLAAFLRGFAERRGLDFQHGYRFQAEHPRLPMPAQGTHFALHGRPAGEREGSLLVGPTQPEGGPEGKRVKGLHASQMLLLRADRIDPAETLLLAPPRDQAGFATIAGFVIEEASGVRESEADRAARERSETLAEKLLEGDELGAAVENGALVVFRAGAGLEEWSDEGIDRFCAEALEVAGRIEDELEVKARPRRKAKAKPRAKKPKPRKKPARKKS